MPTTKPNSKTKPNRFFHSFQKGYRFLLLPVAFVLYVLSVLVTRLFMFIHKPGYWVFYYSLIKSHGHQLQKRFQKLSPLSRKYE